MSELVSDSQKDDFSSEPHTSNPQNFLLVLLLLNCHQHNDCRNNYQSDERNTENFQLDHRLSDSPEKIVPLLRQFIASMQSEEHEAEQRRGNESADDHASPELDIRADLQSEGQTDGNQQCQESEDQSFEKHRFVLLCKSQVP